MDEDSKMAIFEADDLNAFLEVTDLKWCPEHTVGY